MYYSYIRRPQSSLQSPLPPRIARQRPLRACQCTNCHCCNMTNTFDDLYQQISERVGQNAVDQLLKAYDDEKSFTSTTISDTKSSSPSISQMILTSIIPLIIDNYMNKYKVKESKEPTKEPSKESEPEISKPEPISCCSSNTTNTTTSSTTTSTTPSTIKVNINGQDILKAANSKELLNQMVATFANAGIIDAKMIQQYKSTLDTIQDSLSKVMDGTSDIVQSVNGLNKDSVDQTTKMASDVLDEFLKTQEANTCD